jgi:DNA-binding IclR family transcriptional regulator
MAMKTAQPEDRNLESGGVAAVDRALSILDVFTDHDESLSLTEISKRTGFYKSTTLRLAESLEKFGYVRRGDDGNFQLGPKTLRLASLYQRQFRTARFVPPILRQIVAELHEGASFYVIDGDHRVCLHRVDATRAIRDSIHEGDRLPMDVGASGRVLRAFTGSSGKEFEDVRRQFYAASFGERDPEAAAIACPVFGINQSIVGAVALSGPRYRFDERLVERALPILFTHARELTRVFGGNPDAFPRPANTA